MNKSRDCRLLWPSYTLRFLPSYSTPIQCGPHAECHRALPLALLFLCFRDGEVARSRNPPRYTILQHRQSAARTAILFLYDLLSSSFFFHVCGGGSESSNLHRRYSPLAPPLYNRNDALGELSSNAPPELSSSPMLSAYKQHTNCEHFFVQN